MVIKKIDDKTDFTPISYVNGVLIVVDEALEDYYETDEERKPNAPKKRPKKDPEDNLGHVVAFLDTGKIERGVDFLSIKGSLDAAMETKGYGISEAFGDMELLSDICERYEYTLPELVRLMVEHMPETFNLDFLKCVVRPTISSLRKMKSEFESGTRDDAPYYSIFARL